MSSPLHFGDLPGLLVELQHHCTELDEHPGTSFARHGGPLSRDQRRKWQQAEHRVAQAQHVLGSYQEWLELCQTLELQPSGSDVDRARQEVMAATDDVAAALHLASVVETVRPEQSHRPPTPSPSPSPETGADASPTPGVIGPPQPPGRSSPPTPSGPDREAVSATLQASAISLERVRCELDGLADHLHRLIRLVGASLSADGQQGAAVDEADESDVDEGSRDVGGG